MGSSSGHWLLTITARMLSVWMLLLAASFAVGGVDRLHSSSWTGVRELARAGHLPPHIALAALLTIAAVMLWPRRTARAGMWAASFIFAFMAFTFLRSIAVTGDAALSIVVTYGGYGVLAATWLALDSDYHQRK